MNTNKLVKKVKNYFDFSEKKQKKKHDKFLEIVSKLRRKRSKIEVELTEERRRGESSDRYHELSRELKVVTRFIEKANELVHSN
jgi:hypothetical protein